MDLARQIEQSIIKAIFNTKPKPKLSIINKDNYSLSEFVADYAKNEMPFYSYNEAFRKFSLLSISNYLRDTQNNLLFYEAPPRSGKTEIMIMTAVYLMSINNNKNFLFVFGSADKRDEVSDRIREILNSKWIVSRFGKLLTRDLTDNTRRKVLSNGNSILFKSSLSEAPTGQGYHFCFFIDYFTQSAFDSPGKRQKLFRHITGFFTRRQHNPITKVFIDNQRLGRGDLTEVLQDRYKEQNIPFIYIRFPYKFCDEWEAEELRTYAIDDFRYTFKKNSYLLQRFDEETERVEKAQIGVNTFKVQFQGIIEGVRGEIIEETDFEYYNEETLANLNITKLVITIDTALKPKLSSDFSVISLYAFDGAKTYLLDLKRGKWLFHDFETQIEVFFEKWKGGISNNIKHKGIDLLRIEDTAQGSIAYNSIKNKSSATSLRIATILSKYGIKDEAFNPKQSKYQRLSAFLHWIKRHKIYLPAPTYTKFMEVSNVLSFKSEMLEFTAKETHLHDDMVDTFISACEVFYIAKPLLNFSIIEN